MAIRLLSHKDINARGSRPISRVQRWRDRKAKRYLSPVDGGYPECDVDYFDELIAAGIDRLKATAMVEARRSARRAALINQAAGATA